MPNDRFTRECLRAALALRESRDPLRPHAPPPGVDPRPN
jgi:hypothetical protein